MARALGTDDSVNTCDCCGKTDLKFTVIIELDSGDIAHYGSTCASRNTGKGKPVINAEIKAEQARKVESGRTEWRQHAANRAYRARLAERDELARATGARMIGTQAMEFMRETALAADLARNEIASRHGVLSYQIDCFPA